MPDNVRVEVNEAAVRAIVSSDDMRDFLMDEAKPVVTRAQALAPKKTGAGAASIRSEPVIDGDEWTVRVSWTKDHYYLYFRDRGTIYQTGSEFLERALEGATG